MSKYFLNHLDILEAESIHILREVAGQFKRPALLFSGGKDSIVLTRLAEKAFRPGKFPFPLVHIDTGHNFPETIEFRDRLAAKLGEKLIVRYVVDTIKQKGLIDPKGRNASRNSLQTFTLLDTIKEFHLDVCIGGARRDEEKARAKERVFSIRDSLGRWNPHMQRPELWNIYNGRINDDENVRVFPISNWTELDVWNYIKREEIGIPDIYFAKYRDCILRNNKLLFFSDAIVRYSDDRIVNRKVRFRTIGDMTCTAAVESDAETVDDIINELKNTRISERGETRLDDYVSDAAMEDRKVAGYF
jgi:sulfate adenylyltransferase subunit 2